MRAICIVGRIVVNNFRRSFISTAKMSSQFIDIGANLTDSMYQGHYNRSQKHEPDLEDVMARAWTSNLSQMIITGGSLEDSKAAIEMSKKDDRLFATVGCHPTRCCDFEQDPDLYLSGLSELIKANSEKVVAVGEFGLDYDRLNFCPKETQNKYFEFQLSLAEETGLPLFLHCRNAASDLADILSRNRDKIKAGGVVHSFDGSLQEAEKFIEMGYFIGLNGCSLRTEDNLKVAKEIPIDRIMIETDAPWCEIKNTHAGKPHVKTTFDSVKKEKWKKGSLVKGRNEPCCIRQVLEVICGVKGIDITDAAATIHENTAKVFYFKVK